MIRDVELFAHFLAPRFGAVFPRELHAIGVVLVLWLEAGTHANFRLIELARGGYAAAKGHDRSRHHDSNPHSAIPFTTLALYRQMGRRAIKTRFTNV
jgi:hypothetical protein